MTSVSTIGQIAIPVKDLDRAVGFYRDVLGLPFLFQAPPGLAFFDADGVRLLIERPLDEEFAHHSSIIYFKVNDIQAMHREMLERGVAFRDEPHLIAKLPDHDLWMAFFSDNEGNTHALMSEVRLATL